MHLPRQARDKQKDKQSKPSALSAGGTIHGGGRYWWCVRSMWGNGQHNPRALQPALAQHGCATTRAMPNVTRDGQNFTTCPPRMLHIVESKQKNALLFPSFPKYGHF